MNSFTAPSSSPWTSSVCQAFDRDLQRLGLPPLILMEQAAASICAFLSRSVVKGTESNVLFLCGPGNNGADGVAAARQLLGHPWIRPIVALPFGAGPSDGLLFQHLQVYRNLRGQALEGLAEEDHASQVGPSLVVDALFGVGLTRPIDPQIQTWVHSLLQNDPPVLSVDCPSGLDCTTGKALGFALKATWTLSFVAPKAGFFLADGPSHCGEVHVAGIGVRREIADAWLAQGQHF